MGSTGYEGEKLAQESEKPGQSEKGCPGKMSTERRGGYFAFFCFC